MKYRGRVISATAPVANASQASGIWFPPQHMQGVRAGAWPGTGLYSFTNFTLNTAGLTGRAGPSLANSLASYNTTLYPWLTNTLYFNVVTQGYQLWTVPTTGTYTIDAYGAAGGAGNGGQYPGGAGARVKGDFFLTRGTKLKIVVGQLGTNGSTSSGSASGGGGGGTFVMSETGTTNADIYVIAGGGGGTSWYGGSVSNGGAGQATSSTGAGGPAGSGTGGCGGGSILNDGGSSGYGSVGISYSSTALGGNYDGTNGTGGFGGGGSQGFSGAGGGGGQTGGSGGGNAAISGGSGGSSYNNGTNQTNTSGFNTGSGYVIITLN